MPVCQKLVRYIGCDGRIDGAQTRTHARTHARTHTPRIYRVYSIYRASIVSDCKKIAYKTVVNDVSDFKKSFMSVMIQ